MNKFRIRSLKSNELTTSSESSEDYQEIQQKFKRNKIITDYEVEDYEYLRKPIGKSLYKNAVIEEDIKVKKLPSDRVDCEICGGNFRRSNRSAHKKTKKHQLYAKLNKKLTKMLV